MTKLGQFEDAGFYAQRAIQNLERELHLNKSIPVEQNICPSKLPKAVANFKLQMQSLCLAYHHLGTIMIHRNQLKKATPFLMDAYSLARKFLKDKDLIKIISKDVQKLHEYDDSKLKSSALKSSKSSLLSSRSQSNLKKPPKLPYKTIDEKKLLAEIFADGKRKKKKQSQSPRSMKLPSAKSLYIQQNLPTVRSSSFESNSSFPSLTLNSQIITEEKPTSRVSESPHLSIKNSHIYNEIDSVPEFSIEEEIKVPKITYMSQFRVLEKEAAIKIQRNIRGFLARQRVNRLINDKNLISSYSNESIKQDTHESSSKDEKMEEIIEQVMSFTEKVTPTRAIIKRIKESETDIGHYVPGYESSMINLASPDLISPKIRRRAKPVDYVNLEKPEITLYKYINKMPYQ